MAVIFLTMSAASLVHFFYFSTNSVQLMIILGTIYLAWTTWHFSSQAQGLFRFLSFKQENSNFRKIEAYFIGWTYLFVLPYTWLAFNQRFELLFPLGISKDPIHFNIIIAINLIQILLYFALVKNQRKIISWHNWLAAYYMLAPICIGMTPTNFFIIGYYIYLLPHHLTEVYFQSQISRGLILQSKNSLITAAKMALPFSICVVILYYCYQHKTISIAASTGQVSWAKMGDASANFHFAAYFFFLSSFIHFYVDGIMYRFRDDKIKENVLPYLISPNPSVRITDKIFN